ncbi:4456_t:CDS:2, partial [Entrophospora sp. SA101]
MYIRNGRLRRHQIGPLDDTGLTDNGLKDYVLSNFEWDKINDIL